MPAKSIRIYLVRHGESEANLDKTVNARLPDHQVALSPDGHRQADDVGRFLAKSLAPARRLRILCSPYVRARQTSEGIEKALAAAAIAFDKREAIELRELQFGLLTALPTRICRPSFRANTSTTKSTSASPANFCPDAAWRKPLQRCRPRQGRVRDHPARRVGRPCRSGYRFHRGEPRRDHPLLSHAVDALFLGVVRTREESAQLLGATH